MYAYSAYYYISGGDTARQVYHQTKVPNESSMCKPLSQHSSDVTGNILIWKFRCPRGIKIHLLVETEEKHRGKRRTKSSLSSHCRSWNKSPSQSSPKYRKWCNHENAATDQ